MPKCPVPGCQKEFLGDNYVVELSRHLRMVHIGYKLPDSTVSSLSLLPCSLCGLYFSHSRGLTRHFSENHPNSQLPPVFSQFAPPAVTPSSAADQPLSILPDHPRCTFVLLSADEDRIRLHRHRSDCKGQDVKGIDGKEIKEREVKERKDISGEIQGIVHDQSVNSSSPDCSICQDPLLDPLGQLQPCQHTFHFQCISEWLAQESSCPTCRAPVGPCNGMVR